VYGLGIVWVVAKGTLGHKETALHGGTLGERGTTAMKGGPNMVKCTRGTKNKNPLPYNPGRATPRGGGVCQKLKGMA
jgi:hypothetical protein